MHLGYGKVHRLCTFYVCWLGKGQSWSSCAVEPYDQTCSKPAAVQSHQIPSGSTLKYTAHCCDHQLNSSLARKTRQLGKSGGLGRTRGYHVLGPLAVSIACSLCGVKQGLDTEGSENVEGLHGSENDSVVLGSVQTGTDAAAVADVIRLGMRVTCVTTVRSRSGTEG